MNKKKLVPVIIVIAIILLCAVAVFMNNHEVEKPSNTPVTNNDNSNDTNSDGDNASSDNPTDNTVDTDKEKKSDSTNSNETNRNESNIDDLDEVRIPTSENLPTVREQVNSKVKDGIKTGEVSLTNFEYKYNGKETKMTYTISNTTNKDIYIYQYELTFKDNDNKVISRITPTIDTFLKPNESITPVNYFDKTDLTNISYVDFKIINEDGS